MSLIFRIALAIVFFWAFSFALMCFNEAKSAIHEIEGFLSLILALIALTALAALEELVRIRKIIQPKQEIEGPPKKLDDPPEPPKIQPPPKVRTFKEVMRDFPLTPPSHR